MDLEGLPFFYFFLSTPRAVTLNNIKLAANILLADKENISFEMWPVQRLTHMGTRQSLKMTLLRVTVLPLFRCLCSTSGLHSYIPDLAWLIPSQGGTGGVNWCTEYL